MMNPPTIDDIRAAAERVHGAVLRTPMLQSRSLSEAIGAEVWLKFENLQFTSAYKERGALNKLLQLSEEERARGVIAASAGNHAQAVAYHARRLGIPAVIVMPEATPTVKVTQTEGHGATVVLHGAMFDDAYAKACELSDEKGYVFVHPFDDPQIIAGAGTVGLEMLEDAPDLDTLVVPIGGGGLMSGVSIAARAAKPDIELIGVEAELYPSMKCEIDGCSLPLGGDTLAEGIAVKQPGELTSRILKQNLDDLVLVSERDIELIGVEAELYPSMKCEIDGCNLPLGGDTLAEGIAVKQPGELTARILKQNLDDLVLVSERDIESAVAMLVRVEKTVVEGAGAAGLAAMLADPARFKGKKVATLLCGGNIDTHLLANVLVRDLVRQGRIARLRVAAQDQPGALARITAQFCEAGVNIIEIRHSRIFTALPAKDTVIEVECEARDSAAIDKVELMLEQAGFHVERASLD